MGMMLYGIEVAGCEQSSKLISACPNWRIRYLLAAGALVTLLLWPVANAQIYRQIGPNGEVYFTDQPGSAAQPVNVLPAPAVRLAEPSGERSGSGVVQPIGGEYEALTVLSPVPDQGVRANDGNVIIELELKPDLRAEHKIILSIDGEDGEHRDIGRQLGVELSNLSRGRHSVQASVVDSTGKVLIESGVTGFYVLRVAVGNRVR